MLVMLNAELPHSMAWALRNNNVERVRQLLCEGCDPNKSQGYMPHLTYALKYCPGAVPHLLKAGCRILENTNFSPWDVILEKNRFDMVCTFLYHLKRTRLMARILHTPSLPKSFHTELRRTVTSMISAQAKISAQLQSRYLLDRVQSIQMCFLLDKHLDLDLDSMTGSFLWNNFRQNKDHIRKTMHLPPIHAKYVGLYFT